ncbi:hypothetical protein ACJX0J_020261 [Zea mays]
MVEKELGLLDDEEEEPEAEREEEEDEDEIEEMLSLEEENSNNIIMIITVYFATYMKKSLTYQGPKILPNPKFQCAKIILSLGIILKMIKTIGDLLKDFHELGTLGMIDTFRPMMIEEPKGNLQDNFVFDII